MTQKCAGLTDKTLAASIMEFTGSVKRLIELILDYRNVPTGDGHKNKRMGCMLNLLVCVCVCLCVSVSVCLCVHVYSCTIKNQHNFPCAIELLPGY